MTTEYRGWTIRQVGAHAFILDGYYRPVFFTSLAAAQACVNRELR